MHLIKENEKKNKTIKQKEKNKRREKNNL